VQKGDLLVLQEMPEEALARWVTQTFFNFNFTWEPIRGKHVQSVLDVAAPDRLPGRLIQFQPGF